MGYNNLYMKDKFGNDIAVGDYIVYAGSVGHIPDLKVGIIKEITFNPDEVPYFRTRMKVRGVNTNYWKDDEPTLNIKDGTIGNNAVIRTNDIPQKIKDMLDAHIKPVDN